MEDLPKHGIYDTDEADEPRDSVTFPATVVRKLGKDELGSVLRCYYTEGNKNCNKRRYMNDA